jgi:hypothetical protein
LDNSGLACAVIAKTAAHLPQIIPQIEVLDDLARSAQIDSPPAQDASIEHGLLRAL